MVIKASFFVSFVVIGLGSWPPEEAGLGFEIKIKYCLLRDARKLPVSSVRPSVRPCDLPQ